MPCRKPLHHLAFTPGLCLPPSCPSSVLMPDPTMPTRVLAAIGTTKTGVTPRQVEGNQASDKSAQPPTNVFTFLPKFTSCLLPQSPGTALLPSQTQNCSQLWHHLQLPYFCHQTANPSPRLSDSFITACSGSFLLAWICLNGYLMGSDSDSGN